MRTILLTLTVLLLACTLVPAQQIGNTAPVAWERYKVSYRKISFLLPKLPTVHETPSICGEVKSVTYIAYAKGAIYEVTVAGPRRSATQVNCGGNIVSYSPRKLDARLDEVRKEDKYKEELVQVGAVNAVRFKSKRLTRWFFPDASTPAKWIEIAISQYPYDKIDVNRVPESLQFGSTEGKEIGTGSPVTLGDEGVEDSAAANSMFLGATTSPLTLYWRELNFISDRIPKGAGGSSVLLEITFLANGSIGKVSADKQLPYGLTDVAIAQARKISFLPKRRNFLYINDSQTLRYTFLPK
jgi:hypothetical protein